MRPIFRHFLTCGLLSGYAAVALLGQGLHWLSADKHHHHGLFGARLASRDAGHSHSHGHGHCGHHHHHHGHSHHAHHAPASVECDDSIGVMASDGTHQHDCEICAFLARISSERPVVAAATIWQHVYGQIPPAFESSYLPIELGPQAPRGPPVLQA